MTRLLVFGVLFAYVLLVSASDGPISGPVTSITVDEITNIDGDVRVLPSLSPGEAIKTCKSKSDSGNTVVMLIRPPRDSWDVSCDLCNKLKSTFLRYRKMSLYSEVLFYVVNVTDDTDSAGLLTNLGIGPEDSLPVTVFYKDGEEYENSRLDACGGGVTSEDCFGSVGDILNLVMRDKIIPARSCNEFGCFKRPTRYEALEEDLKETVGGLEMLDSLRDSGSEPRVDKHTQKKCQGKRLFDWYSDLVEISSKISILKEVVGERKPRNGESELDSALRGMKDKSSDETAEPVSVSTKAENSQDSSSTTVTAIVSGDKEDEGPETGVDASESPLGSGSRKADFEGMSADAVKRELARAREKRGMIRICIAEYEEPDSIMVKSGGQGNAKTGKKSKKGKLVSFDLEKNRIFEGALNVISEEHTKVNEIDVGAVSITGSLQLRKIVAAARYGVTPIFMDVCTKGDYTDDVKALMAGTAHFKRVNIPVEICDSDEWPPVVAELDRMLGVTLKPSAPKNLHFAMMVYNFNDFTIDIVELLHESDAENSQQLSEFLENQIKLIRREQNPLDQTASKLQHKVRFPEVINMYSTENGENDPQRVKDFDEKNPKRFKFRETQLMGLDTLSSILRESDGLAVHQALTMVQMYYLYNSVSTGSFSGPGAKEMGADTISFYGSRTLFANFQHPTLFHSFRILENNLPTVYTYDKVGIVVGRQMKSAGGKRVHNDVKAGIQETFVLDLLLSNLFRPGLFFDDVWRFDFGLIRGMESETFQFSSSTYQRTLETSGIAFVRSLFTYRGFAAGTWMGSDDQGSLPRQHIIAMYRTLTTDDIMQQIFDVLLAFARIDKPFKAILARFDPEIAKHLAEVSWSSTPIFMQENEGEEFKFLKESAISLPKGTPSIRNQILGRLIFLASFRVYCARLNDNCTQMPLGLGQFGLGRDNVCLSLDIMTSPNDLCDKYQGKYSAAKDPTPTSLYTHFDLAMRVGNKRGILKPKSRLHKVSHDHSSSETGNGEHEKDVKTSRIAEVAESLKKFGEDVDSEISGLFGAP